MGPTPFAEAGRFMLTNPHARALTRLADDVLGYPVFERYREGGDYTEAAQVAFLINCLALARTAEEELGGPPLVCTGPSFGEKPLIAYAGVLPDADAIRVTALIARELESFVAVEHTDVVTLSFTRTPGPLLREVLAELDERGEWYEVSCYVDHDFHMLSLREPMTGWLSDRLRRDGGLPLYTMRPPMHSTLLGGLRERVAASVLAGLRFADPAVPVIADQDGAVLTTGDAVRTMLLDGFTRAMRWPDVVAALRAQGVERVYVCGPDKLFGRVRATTDAFEVVTANPRWAAARPRRQSSPV
ncbi:ACP S-malonyltransferase [Micromonospora arborensis]|uniref:[acyl-carrier-protein] S-malonyltransferase n=2 Tax=Micromonospora arborensis TaxID=2116518 RepID=A0A318NEZ2_9ACTN|nr:ACP S-malonyltransferase [Micromonospora arborensis]